MAKPTSRFFILKPSKGGSYYKAGYRLITRSGKDVGSVCQDRESKKFVLFLSNGGCEEFASFNDAEAFAWANGI